jgi:hypothetical protein
MVTLVPACAPYQVRPDSNDSVSAPARNPAERPDARLLPPLERPTLPPQDPQLKQTALTTQTQHESLIPAPPSRAELEATSQQLAHAEPQRLPEPVVKTKAKPVQDPTIVAVLRCFLDKRPAEAVRLLDQYDKPTQDLLLCLLPLVARFSEGSVQKADPQETLAALTQLNSVADQLRPRTPLLLDKLFFCKAIKKFGVFEPYEENHAFEPGECVELYVEVQNFSYARSGSRFVVQLDSTIDIREYNGNLFRRLPSILGRDHPKITQTEPHDLSNHYAFWVPRDIPSGRYTLHLYVTDGLTGRGAEKTVDFRVVAPRD